MRLFYVDDSGTEQIAVISAITFELEAWRTVLKEWLGWRKWLYKTYGLPTDFELHAQEFVTGRGTILVPGPEGEEIEPEISASVAMRKKAYRQSLAQIDRQEEISVITGVLPGATIADAYAKLIAELNELLEDRGEDAIFIVDGKDDSSYRPAHRDLELRTRRIVEDPLMQSSRHSQFIQIADLVAHAAFQHLDANPTKRFMWDRIRRSWAVRSSIRSSADQKSGPSDPEKTQAPRWRGLSTSAGPATRSNERTDPR